MRRILFVTKSLHDSAARYRAQFLREELERRGWEIAHASCDQPMARLRILVSALRADIVFIQRKQFGALFLRLLKACCAHLTFDLDDAIFLRSNGRPAPRRAARFAAVCRISSRVFAGNSYLAEAARPHTDKVLLAPTCVDMRRYPERTDVQKTVELVWIGSSSTRKYLLEAAPALVMLKEKQPQTRLRIIADFEWPECPLSTEAVRWSEAGEVAALQSARIGIAPMPDNPWTRGKCGLKTIQYMAAGLPVIADRCGAHVEIIEHGVTGMLVSGPQEWADVLAELLADPERCRQMGAAGRERANLHYAAGSMAGIICDVLESLTPPQHS